MCGILGAISSRDRIASLRANEALARMQHRGPDGRGEFRSGRVYLAHQRLAIIDPSESAAQPMAFEGCGTVVFNGEIYDHANHRRRLEAAGEVFATTSDTEVLIRGLAREGEGFLRGLHGMYAFAWLDPTGERLLLARDHAGMKPAYLWRGRDAVAFASEVRSLGAMLRALGASPRPSAEALTAFLEWGSVPEPRCVLAGAEMIPADHVVEIDVREPSRVRARAIGTRRARSSSPRGEAALPELHRALTAAVERHLVADRPVALFLSSGIDSGGIAAEIVRSGAPRPQAISVTLGASDTSDEPAIVRRLAERLGLPLHVVTLSDCQRRLANGLEAYDQPSVDGLNTYLISTVATDLGYRVALSGVGADEVFGGYGHLHRQRRMPTTLLRALGHAVGPLLARQHDPRMRRLGLVATGVAAGEPLQQNWRRIWSRDQIRRLLPDVPLAPSPRDEASDPLRFEQDSYLRDTLLRDADVMGMACGLEIRAPFLDPAVLDAAADVGTATLLRRDRPAKWVLRERWSHELEPASLARPKSGFTLDMAKWLRGAGREMLAETRRELARRACVDRRALAATWDGWEARLATGHSSAWSTLFSLVQLNAQLARWGDPTSVADAPDALDARDACGATDAP